MAAFLREAFWQECVAIQRAQVVAVRSNAQAWPVFLPLFFGGSWVLCRARKGWLRVVRVRRRG
eukprot:10523779-Lingulodinium_polyedra.AAC.1